MDEEYKELIEILIELTQIVCALSEEDDDFSGSWKADEVLSKLKALQTTYQVEENQQGGGGQ